jgi:formate hydrogenlyase subunit 3/multisubunit Na+/H+ antiporter MnhD subunit
MNSNILYKRFMALFGGLMTVFYIAIGLYIALSPNLDHIESFIRYLIGFTFLVYGSYRAIRAYNNIKEAFLSNNDEEQ